MGNVPEEALPVREREVASTYAVITNDLLKTEVVRTRGQAWAGYRAFVRPRRDRDQTRRVGRVSRASMVSERGKEEGTMKIKVMAVGLGLGLVGVTRSWLVLVPVLVLLSLGQGFASPTMQATMTNAISADVRGELLGVVARWSSFARVAGPIVGGLLFQKVGKSSPFLVGAGLYAICVLILSGRSRAHTARTGISS